MTKKMIFKIALILIGWLESTCLYAAFFDQSAQGWHWYQDPIIIKKEQQDPEIVPVTPTPTETIKTYQKELETRLHKAILNPSYQNVQAYQEMQKDLTDRSQKFSETWMQVVFQNPHLDHTLVSPTNHTGRHVYLDQEKQIIKDTISNLKDEYGLFFFFSSQCEYCHKFAPIVQQFAKNYDWKIMAISLDGGSIPGFLNPVPDNGIAAKWQVIVLPSLFAVNPTTGHVLPIAFGLTSIDQMENRIMTLLKNPGGTHD